MLITIDRNDPQKILSIQSLYRGQNGRIRDVYEGKDGALYFLTNNRDSRGVVRQGDDKIIRLVPAR
ncbi:PQQ-dependent sugar dehydrogenase [Brevibacillus fluminis]|uniref:PQQ-dependent sugar dehydrogenase n=1 Tax=Brevibacillus fluminis TaxID=511487 RepID=UPI003F8C0EEF